MNMSFRENPVRVQILKGDGSYIKTGQFAYIVATNDIGGMWVQDRTGESKPGEVAYLISKTKNMAGGALWFTTSAVRITGRPKKTKA